MKEKNLCNMSVSVYQRNKRLLLWIFFIEKWFNFDVITTMRRFLNTQDALYAILDVWKVQINLIPLKSRISIALFSPRSLSTRSRCFVPHVEHCHISSWLLHTTVNTLSYYVMYLRRYVVILQTNCGLPPLV